MIQGGGTEPAPCTIDDLLIPRWQLQGDQYIYVGDEVALLSPLTGNHEDAYGRIAGLDPEGSGHPVVVVFCGPRHRPPGGGSAVGHRRQAGPDLLGDSGWAAPGSLGWRPRGPHLERQP